MGLLIAVIGSSLLHESRSASTGAASYAAGFQATLAADGAINRAILSFIDPSDPQHWHIDGTVRTLQVFDHNVTIRAESENGKIDLNAAPQSLLVALFRGARLSATDSQTLAERVIAWRTRVPTGAIDSTTNIYRDAGRSYGPRHGPFRSTGELRMVLGMSDAVEASVASAVTVYSGSATVDRGVASDDVLRILQSSGDRFAAAQLLARANGNAAGGDRLPTAGEVLSIFAKAESHGAIAERFAVIRLRGDTSLPYTVLEWQ
jgi:general secretion pathway protein K